MFLEDLKKFIINYGKNQLLQLAGFTCLSFIAGHLEFVGVALIYPFILMIIQPEKISPFIPFENSMTSGLLIGLLVLLIFILKNTLIIFTQYIQNKFVNNWCQEIVNKFMKYYLFAPYKQVMKTSQSDKLFILEGVCPQVIEAYIMRCLNLLTNTIIVFMVILLLLIKFPIPAVVTIIFVSITTLIQNRYFKARTASIEKTLAIEAKKYKTALIENINNIKDLKILSAEKSYYDNFTNSALSMRDIMAKQGFYTSIPPYIVEILVVCSLLVMAFILSIQNLGNNSSLIASFAIVVAALFRIAPTLNRIQSAVIGINTTRNFVKRINEEYEKCDFSSIVEYNPVYGEKIDLSNKIELKNISFSYDGKKEVIKNISFEINKGDFVGIIGLSGAGKSTLADILTGLLPSDSGQIFVDDKELTQQNFAKFRGIIGYVPQQINILDRSIKENVAWGCEKNDEQGVIKALKASQLFDIINEYPEGINSNIIIGSNGLSQGQKQRLAIARALYRDPEIIILDEATSALDVQTENEITEVLKEIGKSKTIIAIAHRLSTLKACNKLIYMKDGQIVDIGTFEELSSRYEDFANLVKLSKIN